MREPSEGPIHLRRMSETIARMEETLQRMEGRLQRMDRTAAFIEQALRACIAKAGKDTDGQV